MLLALILFLITYVLMISLPKYRYIIAISAAVIFVILGIMPLSGVVSAINWNVLMMLTGTMGTVSLFIDSKMPNRLADWLQNLPPMSCGQPSFFLCLRASFPHSLTTLPRF